MLFISLEYLLFLPTVVALYYLLPVPARAGMLAIASGYFYLTASWKFGLILLGSIGVDYFAALQIDKSTDSKTRRLWIIASLATNLSILGYFKYSNFFLHTLHRATSTNSQFVALDIVLPIGISFYTFQAMSYTLDVYRKERIAERSFVRFALFVLFFPQLIAGPIERSSALLPQLIRAPNASYQQFVQGLRLILFGVLKKVVVADQFAHFADLVFINPNTYSRASLLFGLYAFAIQIYFDFSAYSDIARGSARLMGIELSRNFRLPYWSASFRGFWRRWHISLSSWFRDYLYYPLGGNRKSLLNLVFALGVVFILSGFWHGAKWTFLAWGAFHWMCVSLEVIATKALTPLQKNAPKLWRSLTSISVPLRVFAVFHLCCFGWILFRAGSMNLAVAYCAALFTTPVAEKSLNSFNFSYFDLAFFASSVFLFEAIEFARDKKQVVAFFNSLPTLLRWTVYYAGIAVLLLFGQFSSADPFIYFQF